MEWEYKGLGSPDFGHWKFGVRQCDGYLPLGLNDLQDMQAKILDLMTTLRPPNEDGEDDHIFAHNLVVV